MTSSKEHYFISTTQEDVGRSAAGKSQRNQFQFITSAGVGVPKNDEPARTIIRKQAMREAVESRRNAGDKKRNLRRMPGNILTRREKSGRAVTEDQLISELLAALSAHFSAVPPRPSLKGYELVRVRYGIDVATLSMLTTFHVGRATVNDLSKNPSQLKVLLRQKGSSYFSYLPSRFNHAPFLQDVFECVVARIRQILTPVSEIRNEAVLSLYSKALKSMQAALNSPLGRLQPELLCAISMLSLFELLDSSRAHAWMHHAAAARSLVTYQGPFRRDDEFGKALFIAQTGPIITEAILDNETCFLQDDAWQGVFQSVVTDGIFHERSLTVVSLRMLMALIPGIISDVSHTVCSNDFVDIATIEALRARVQSCRVKLLKWRRDFDAMVTGLELSPIQRDLMTEVLGTYLVCLILINRLGASVCIDRSIELEDDTVAQANTLIDIVSSIPSDNPHTYLFMVQKMKVAHVALATADDWRSAKERYGNEAYKAGMIPPSIFRDWSTRLGRKTP